MTREEQIFAYRELRGNGQAFFVDNYEDADRIIEALEEMQGRADERAELIEDVIQELDILNHQGGGIDDILVYLNGLKEQKNG